MSKYTPQEVMPSLNIVSMTRTRLPTLLSTSTDVRQTSGLQRNFVSVRKYYKNNLVCISRTSLDSV